MISLAPGWPDRRLFRHRRGARQMAWLRALLFGVIVSAVRRHFDDFGRRVGQYQKFIEDGNTAAGQRPHKAGDRRHRRRSPQDTAGPASAMIKIATSSRCFARGAGQRWIVGPLIGLKKIRAAGARVPARLSHERGRGYAVALC